MNYIKRLEHTTNQQAAEIVGLRAMIDDITAYLLSPKFHREQWVNPSDILSRFAEGDVITQRLIDETPNPLDN